MTDKLEHYDIFGTVVPGILLLCWVGICFPSVAHTAPMLNFPDAFNVMALVALAIFLGQLLQGVGSLLEPAIHRAWGGRPSDRALAGGLGRYLARDTAHRIKKKLQTAVATEATDHSLFLFAMQRTDAAKVGCASRFNSLYAYHRALLVLMSVSSVLLVASRIWGAVATWPLCRFVMVSVGIALLLMLVWRRTKQRAFYYVREVLLTAERVIDEMQNQPDHKETSC